MKSKLIPIIASAIVFTIAPITVLTACGTKPTPTPTPTPPPAPSIKTYELKHNFNHQGLKRNILTVSANPITITKDEEIIFNIHTKDWTAQKKVQNPIWYFGFCDANGDFQPMNSPKVKIEINDKQLIVDKDYEILGDGIIMGMGNYQTVTWDTSIKITASLANEGEGATINCYPAFLVDN